MNLSFCQQVALQKLEGEGSLFITGYAGTGKSFLIQQYLARETRYESIPVLASTGAAAVLIGGRTFHSFFGLGVMRGLREAVVEKAVRNRNVGYRLRKAQAVIIDEVSMLSGETLAVAEEIARKTRKDDSPWGGLRLIAVGDFAQLPPIGDGGNRPWAFLHPVWEATAFEPMILKTPVRTAEAAYLSVLNQVREGVVSTDLKAFLDSRTVVPEEFEGTRLFPKKNMTEKHNLEKLETLPGKTFRSITEYTGSEEARMSLVNSAPIPDVLHLKKHALVMIRVNDPKQRYVNGTIGKVADWDDECVYVTVGRKTIEIEKTTFSYFNGDGDLVASAVNFPINLAWAATIHKAQGATLERVLVDLAGLWEPGQAYVALSRARSSEDVFISRWNEKSIRSDPAVTEFYRRGCPVDFADRCENISEFNTND